MTEIHQAHNPIHYSETPLFRAALWSLLLTGLFLFFLTDFVVGLVLEGHTIAAVPAVLVLGTFVYVSTLAAFEPRMDFKIRLASFVIGVAAALPLMFAIMYAVAHVKLSGCISVAETASVDIASFRYFSFTTFTTLGYGDIGPLGICRSLSSAEAMLGLIYMGVLVAVISEVISSRRSQD